MKIILDAMGGDNAPQAPVMIVVSEEPYSKMAAAGSVVSKNDYRSMDIGIAVAYLTAEAAAQGLSTCILGWLDESEVRKICGLKHTVRLVIAVGYAKEDDPLRNKKRKPIEDLATFAVGCLNISWTVVSGFEHGLYRSSYHIDWPSSSFYPNVSTVESKYVFYRQQIDLIVDMIKKGTL